MKVCHLITRMIVGGAQENTLLSARGLHEAGHETVLMTGPSPGPEGELLRNCGRIDFRVEICPTLCREIDPLRDWRSYRALVKFFKAEKFDVVHTHASKAGIIGRYAARAAGVPLVVHTVHGLPFSRIYPAWKNAVYIKLERMAAKRCDRIFAVAQDMIDQCLANRIGRPEMFKVVYSGMELEPFLTAEPDPELRRSLGIPDGAKVVGTLARLFPMKGYVELWKSIPEIVKRVPNVHFLLIGNGILREKLEAEAVERGFRDHLSFAGLVPPAQVPRHLALTDVLVHFSMREGLPRAAVQALAMRKPVVAFDIDGTREVVLNGKTGCLLQPGGDMPGVEEISELLLNDAKRREFGEAGRALVKPRFDWRLMSDTLIEEYAKYLEIKKKGLQMP